MKKQFAALLLAAVCVLSGCAGKTAGVPPVAAPA